MTKMFAALAAVAALIFFAPIIGVLFGALTGWVVGLFFGDTILGFLSRLGVDTIGLAMWQVGAAMGFLGSFLRATITHSKS